MENPEALFGAGERPVRRHYSRRRYLMLAFGLGTLPNLLFVGFMAARLPRLAKNRGMGVSLVPVSRKGGIMKGVCIRFYMHENLQHHHILASEWLLEQARKMGIHGGSAFRAIAGFGRHGFLHEDHFFELADDLPVIVEFVVSGEEAERLLALVQTEKMPLFYLRTAVEYGILNGEAHG